jgi:glycerol kinase
VGRHAVTVLVIDCGTSNVRVATVADGSVVHETRTAAPPDTPAPGLVEIDPVALVETVLGATARMLDVHGPVDAVGIATQRATTIVWDRTSGEPVGPGLGWQDLRTIGECLTLAAEGIRLAPNQTATKAAWLWDQVDPDRGRDLCVGTVDSWLVWHLTGGRTHVTDASNAGVTGLLRRDGSGWDEELLDRLRIPVAAMPALVDSTGIVAEASALDGAPPIAGVAGDQQASLVGQRCVHPGQAKITFGTGGMLDVCLGPDRPAFEVRGEHGSFPVVAWRRAGALTWGAEAIMLSAGAEVEWLCTDLGLIDEPAQSHEVAAACEDTGGVRYVPALLGLGTPDWDYGARGTLLGITRGTGRPEVVRAVLEGVAQRGADLADAVRADTGVTIETLRVDGGMSVNPTFVQALADACERPVELSHDVEATAVGAGILAALAVGDMDGMDDVAATWRPRAVIEPAGPARRDEWAEALVRARAWYPELTAIDF